MYRQKSEYVAAFAAMRCAADASSTATFFDLRNSLG